MQNILKLLFLIFLISCGNKIKDKQAKNVNQTPKNFSIRIEFNDNDYFDSKDSSLIRRYNFSDTTLKTWLSDSEMGIIYRTMVENNFFTLPKSIPLDTTKPYTVCSDEDRIIVFIDGKKKINVKFDRGGTPADTNISKRFDKVFHPIINILTRSKNYKKLSPSNILCL